MHKDRAENKNEPTSCILPYVYSTKKKESREILLQTFKEIGLGVNIDKAKCTNMARKQNRQQPHYVLYVINNLRIY
jgi:hypothetical protein